MQFHLVHLFMHLHSISVDYKFRYKAGKWVNIRSSNNKYYKTLYLGAKFKLFKHYTSASQLCVSLRDIT